MVIRRCVVLSLAAAVHAVNAQTPVRREDAVATAVAQGARLGIARADTAIAYAALLTARALQN